MLNSYINNKYINNINLEFNRNKNFKYLILKNFFKKELIIKFKKKLLKEKFYFKESDLFSFYQTNDLINNKNKNIYNFYNFFNSVKFKTYTFSLTGIRAFGKIDCAGFIYKNTNYLLPHDDELEKRKIAYILYLNDLNEDEGGQLQFFNNNKLIKSISPKFNTLILFRAEAGKTIHQVKEVVGKNTKRLSIAGWFNDK